MITEEQFADILDDISFGKPTWRAVDERGIACGTFYKFRDREPGRCERYARAKAKGVEGVVEDAMRIADDQSIEHNHKRIQVDLRKWYAAKIAPKVYGERVELTGEINHNLLEQRMANGRKRITTDADEG